MININSLIAKYESYVEKCDPYCCVAYIEEIITDLKDLSNKHSATCKEDLQVQQPKTLDDT